MSIAFSACRSRADYLRKLIDVENEASPAEMRQLWSTRHELPQAAVAQMKTTIDLMDECSTATRPFARIALSPQVNFFFVHGAHRAQKSLLVCFCGIANRMMMPIPAFLQLMPEDRFDVLILKDPTGLGYLRGVPAFGNDLREVTDTISVRLDSGSYADVRCLGVSAGGAVALYAGLLLHAERAVSICGRHRSQSSKLGNFLSLTGKLTGYEFDEAVRHLAGSPATRLIAVFGGMSSRDRDGAVSLKGCLPSCEMLPVGDLTDHNVLVGLLRSGGVTAFLDKVLFRPRCTAPVAAAGGVGR